MTPGPEATALRGASLRVTRPRVAVLAALDRRPHADADTVATAVREDLGSVSTQAVYDVLHALTHHHLVCRGCGSISDVDCAVGDAPCLEAAADQGFLVDEAEVTYWGLCPDCR